MTGRCVDFYFDYVCPFAYLASTQVEALFGGDGVEVRWHPILLGGLLQALGAPTSPPGQMPPAKLRHIGWDLERWADLLGVPLALAKNHPRPTLLALRATLAVPAGAPRRKVIDAFFRAYWVRGLDLGSDETVAQVLSECGFDGAAIVQRVGDAERQALHAETDAAREAGVFGVPTVVVDGEIFWGLDRLWMARAHALGGTPSTGAHLPGPAPAGSESAPSDAVPSVDFFFDFASPFSYLGSTQIEALCARYGAPLRWRPMLLGGLFKMHGIANIPMAVMSEPKRRNQLTDLHRWATYWGVPFQWPSRFPMRTLAPLRIALGLLRERPEHASAFIAATYRAYWAEDRDIADERVLRGILAACGVDEDAVGMASDPRNKRALIEATEQAYRLGVFGAPTTIVGGRWAFWGQDRLGHVERVLQGWTPPETTALPGEP